MQVDYEFMKKCEFKINPAYLKLVEGIYHHLIFPVAAFCRIERGKSLDGLDIYNRVEEIRKTKYAYLCEPYDNKIRNTLKIFIVKMLLFLKKFFGVSNHPP